MTKCPKCKKELTKPKKTWKYGIYTVQAYLCDSCGAEFRDYLRNGKYGFTLKLQKGKGYVKA